MKVVQIATAEHWFYVLLENGRVYQRPTEVDPLDESRWEEIFPPKSAR